MDIRNLKGRKLIKCPYCREYLIDVDRNTLARIYRAKKGKGLRPIPGMKSKPCKSCHGTVGIVLSDGLEGDMFGNQEP